jgi:hypothetical protein
MILLCAYAVKAMIVGSALTDCSNILVLAVVTGFLTKYSSDDRFNELKDQLTALKNDLEITKKEVSSAKDGVSSLKLNNSLRQTKF